MKADFCAYKSCHSNTYYSIMSSPKTVKLKIKKKKKIELVGDNSLSVTKPLLKWVGGKTQIINELVGYFPKCINNYHEIFLGGGSVLLAFLTLVRSGQIMLKGKVYASDLNGVLINFYKNVQSNKDELYNEVSKLVAEYTGCSGDVINREPKSIDEAKTSRESYYYWIRKTYNELVKGSESDSPKVSAMFLFLNKTCFRGVYRVGPNGFNVPFGHYKTVPTVLNWEHLVEMSSLIKDVVFQHLDFENSLKKVVIGDFAYLDPPYAPETKTSFVGYTKDGFTLESHKNLFEMLIDMRKKAIMFVMSNAKVELVDSSFTSDLFKIKDIECRRAIHSKKPDSKTMEVIVSSLTI